MGAAAALAPRGPLLACEREYTCALSASSALAALSNRQDLQPNTCAETGRRKQKKKGRRERLCIAARGDGAAWRRGGLRRAAAQASSEICFKGGRPAGTHCAPRGAAAPSTPRPDIRQPWASGNVCLHHGYCPEGGKEQQGLHGPSERPRVSRRRDEMRGCECGC